MTTNKRRVAAISGLVALGAAAIAVFIANRPKTHDQNDRTESKGTSGWGQIVIVVSSLDNYQNLLNQHPSLVLVGTKSTKLRQSVNSSDQHRIIETQTETGWQHIVKHLRPDTVILSQGLDQDSIKGFTKQVLLMEDAYAMLTGGSNV